MAAYIFIKTSTIAVLLSILSAIFVNFRFSTGFLTIKSESRNVGYSASNGIDSSDRKSYFNRWKIIPDTRDTRFLFSPRPLLPLQNWVFKVLEVITGSGSRSRKKCANQIKDQCLISKNELPSTLRRSSKNKISYLEGRGAVKQKIFEYFQNDPSSVRFKSFSNKLLKKRRFESEDFSKIFLLEGKKWIEQKGYILCSHADCVSKNFNKRVSLNLNIFLQNNIYQYIRKNF